MIPNYTEFMHETLHIKPSKYDSTSGTKIYICFIFSFIYLFFFIFILAGEGGDEAGIRLWIGTSTFNSSCVGYQQNNFKETAQVLPCSASAHCKICGVNF